VIFTFGVDAKTSVKPNVILVITDDQGFGDLGFMGIAIFKPPFSTSWQKKVSGLTGFLYHPYVLRRAPP
jgi:arylsulfatase A-like enzyme